MTILAPMSIGSEIKRERKVQYLTQKELAVKCGFTQMELSEYENGKRTPSTERLETIAEALGKEWKLR